MFNEKREKFSSLEIPFDFRQVQIRYRYKSSDKEVKK
jgi:hypothetical protein